MITSDISQPWVLFSQRDLWFISKYLEIKTKYLTIIGALANGGSQGQPGCCQSIIGRSK